MANIIEADVIQKIATEAEWLTQTRIPYQGQIMIVSDSAGKVVNIKVGDGANTFADLNYMFDSIQQNASFVTTTGSTLPTPSVDPAFTILGDGDYGSIPADEGNMRIATWDGSVWTVASTVAMPTVSGADDFSDPNSIPKVSAIEDYVEPLFGLVRESTNYVDTSTIQSGYLSSVNGGSSSSDNWIRIPYHDIPSDLWSQEVTVGGFGNVVSSGLMVSFRDGSNMWMGAESIIGEGVSTPYSITFTIPTNARRWGFSITNDPSDGGIGTRPQDNPFVNDFRVNLGSELLPYEPYGYVFNTDLLPPLQYDTSEILIKKVNNSLIEIYFHIGGHNSTWFKINLIHQTNPSLYIDVWRLNEGYIVQRSGDEFISVRKVIHQGVYENAIATTGTGYTDFLGSAHGFEMLIEGTFRVLMDGKEIDIDTLTIEKGTYLQFFTATNFITEDGLSSRGKSVKRWDFRDGVFKINNLVNWYMPMQISTSGASYFSMLSLLRGDASGNITHSALSNEDGIVYDVSSPEFETPIFSDSNNPKRNTLVVWGDFFKAEMQATKRKITLADGTILPFGLPTAGMHVQNVASPNYNKMYGRMGRTTVEAGDTWETETVYILSNI